ncbi:uncharacterized protein C8R40DRAFT_1173173 [Lentinula edodes]|uniref:uncharacterized protein n=1 Tax=Lentinula edodes TaxID=5353 RepID=UPI001E8CA1E1|nr:uncharacterized protein C8R40DRAFT_1173173 [Lentinula edodes]KAH7872776.1 hypothetical protein C8R40DRAFT_1173173 [Lentinula edodes]
MHQQSLLPVIPPLHLQDSSTHTEATRYGAVGSHPPNCSSSFAHRHPSVDQSDVTSFPTIMAQYLSQPSVESFWIWLSENDHSILGAEIDRLVDHISGLYDQLNVLRRAYQARITPILEERAKKLPKYNFLVNFVSPIGQLPQESLSEIFTQALFRGGSSTGSRPRPLSVLPCLCGLEKYCYNDSANLD